MEGAPNDGTSADPAMTPIERQMQVIATSIQDLARETSRQNQELWQAIRKGPPTPHDDNQPPPRGRNTGRMTKKLTAIKSLVVGTARLGEPHPGADTGRKAQEVVPVSPQRKDRNGEAHPDDLIIQNDHQDQIRTMDQDRDGTTKEKELREMKELKQDGGSNMKNSLRAKAALSNLDNCSFKVPLLENFDGTKDPFDYLEAFKTIMQLQAVPEEVMCRAFPLGLRGSARVWFNKLESESIGSFVQLSRAFIDHFIGSQRRGRPPTHLLSVKQMEGESLRTFVHRFNEEAMKIDRPKEDVTVTAFMAGLRKGDFLYELCKDPPETMSELMRKEAEDRKTEPAKQKVPKFTETPERKRTTAPPVKFSSFTPLNTPIDKLLLQIQDDPSLRWPGKIRSDPNSRPKNLYCRFHRDHGHLTEECVALKEQIETLIRQGKLQKYVSRPTNTRPAKPPAQRQQAEHNRPGPVGEIRTIVGGPASGGTSRASRKAYARQVHNIMVVQRPPKNIRLDDQIISFTEEDARGTHQPHDDALVITINIAGFTTRRVMIDNGSSADILYLPAYQQMRQARQGQTAPHGRTTRRIQGDKVCPVGIVTLPITVGTHPKTVSKTVDFLLVDCPSAYNAIIGRPTLNRLRAVTSTYHLLLEFPTEHGIGEVRGDQVAARECYLASLGPGGQNQTMAIEEQKILVKPSGELDTIGLEDGRPERTTKIGNDLPPRIKESLVRFLKENKDVFAWSHEDMPGIDPSIISHKLNVDPSLRPIKQKRRVFAPERNNAIMEEVDKLLAANFIREVFYPDWLANVVMVKKSTGKWRMCVDFTDLNKACPKDSFPLPRIDQLVDSTAGHKLLTFMDAFSGYNQIVMDDERDQEKTSFITSRGLFCYKVMPFGLKNAGATYQRLMNRMFHDQIGRNVEVYVDDMLVKSKEEEDGHLDDLRETFQTLRKYQMKLNPSKCAFGVYSGKFLGFMVSQRGIEVNPDKIKAILEMRPPKNTKEVQRLTGRIAALNRFVSRSTDNPSKRGEELYLYLAVSPTAISSALIREEERQQLPVYYTSKALREAEERYPPMEKLAFALVTAARKLRPYFQAHTIVLLTNHPLRKAMNKPDAAGRLVQWSIELSEFDIDYRPRTAIKAQALADFIAEFTSKEDEPTEDVEQTSKWTMNIDGSATKDSGGVGVVLKSPEGDTIKQAVRLQYPTTNNEAEYEALLTGLEMAKVLGATELETGTLYKKSFSLPYLRCLAPDEANYVLREIHEGVCGNHSGARALQRKVVRAGYYWPSMQADASRFVQHCDKCQRFANLVHSPPTALVPMTAPWPFAQWGLDIMGPFPIGRRQLKFLVVAIDYFTKWVEAEPLATITEKNVQSFVWKAVICRFGIPRVLVSDNGKQFDNPRFRQFSQELGIHNHYSSPGHPQANGQVEVTNRSLLKLIKTRLEGAKGLWPEELPSILWAYRTTVRIPTGETPFRMTFGSEAVVPVEIGMTTLRTSAYDNQQNEEQLRLNLDLIDEIRETAETRMKRYQDKMARHYNSKVKPRQLSVGDLVLRKVTLATKDPSLKGN
uniref:Uncharacterized protein n=1 Tax=Fagus sylvatica TaxID=28930 RepID=A0A2N9FH63_FAGSY